MEKLELKHLAPYLPYKLKYLSPEMKQKSLIVNYKPETIEEMKIVSMMSVIQSNGVLKPILRPLSDLDKDKLKEFNFITIPTINDDIGSYSYGFIKYCFKNHFDIFGLIEKGLAIDKNTLK